MVGHVNIEKQADADYPRARFAGRRDEDGAAFDGRPRALAREEPGGGGHAPAEKGAAG
jgi:hypothetical protein